MLNLLCFGVHHSSSGLPRHSQKLRDQELRALKAENSCNRRILCVVFCELSAAQNGGLGTRGGWSAEMGAEGGQVHQHRGSTCGRQQGPGAGGEEAAVSLQPQEDPALACEPSRGLRS